MRLAIEQAKSGDAPYGAIIVKDQQVIVSAHNTVKRASDPTAHAEINALRLLATSIQSPNLEGYTLYTSCEPCPMCAAACFWAGISEIVIGATIQDLIELGVHQIDIPCETILAQGTRPVKIQKGLLRSESLQLFTPPTQD